ncbi:MAG: translation initiation factor IF-3 [Phycisphaerae bacterium]|nr:translation initiation factor IF-3 [Phycisphaerae bacterium]
MRVNEEIRIPNVRVIGAEGQQLGVLATQEALRIARQDGLDLVEVAPKENPPVCRILDFDKYRYQQQKKEHEARKKQHVIELKELRIRPKTDRHDQEIKTNRARQFLDEGHKVQFTMLFRGRERLHENIGHEIFREIAESLQDVGKVERESRLEGRRMVLILVPAKAAPPPKKSGEAKKQPPKSEPKASASPSAEAPAEPPVADIQEQPQESVRAAGDAQV